MKTLYIITFLISFAFCYMLLTASGLTPTPSATIANQLIEEKENWSFSFVEKNSRISEDPEKLKERFIKANSYKNDAGGISLIFAPAIMVMALSVLGFSRELFYKRMKTPNQAAHTTSASAPR